MSATTALEQARTMVANASHADLVGAVTSLAIQLDAMTASRNHWRDNHYAQVDRARVLIERPDMPLERVQAFKLLQDLGELGKYVDLDALNKDVLDYRAQIARLRARIEELEPVEADANGCCLPAKAVPTPGVMFEKTEAQPTSSDGAAA